MGELIGTTIPLEQDAAVNAGPTTTIGRIAWAWASMFSLAVVGLVIALMSGPLLTPFEEFVTETPYIVKWWRRRRARLRGRRGSQRNSVGPIQTIKVNPHTSHV